MDSVLLKGLQSCETDLDGVRRRFGGDEAFYVSCLSAFLSDPTVQMLSEAIATRSWDDAFTAAHALKGLAGNMGFVPLAHATGELVLTIRAGRVSDVADAFREVLNYYNDIMCVIRSSCTAVG